MASNEFVPLNEILSELDKKQQERLKRITKGIESTELVNATINKETGNLRFVDEEGRPLLEIEKEGLL